MSVVVTLRPDGTVAANSNVGNPSTVVVGGGGDRAAVLRDNTDTTYHVGTGLGATYYDLYDVSLSDFLLPPGALIEYVQPRARVAMVGNYAQHIGLWPFVIDGVNTSWEITVARDSAIHAWTGDAKSRSPRSNRDWTQDEVNHTSIRARFYDLLNAVSGDAYLYELYLDVSYKRIGSVAITSITGTDTSRPAINWAPSAPDNPNPQEKYRIRVFEPAVYNKPGFDERFDPAVWESGDVVSSSARSAQIGSRLREGLLYRVFVWVSQPWAGTAVDWFCSPNAAYFAIDLPPLPPCTIDQAVGDGPNACAVITTGAYVSGGSGTTYELYRSADGGATWDLVDDQPQADAEPKTIVDHLAPRAVPLVYKLRAVTEENTSDWTADRVVVVPIDGFRLKHLSDPTRSIVPRVVAFSPTRPEPQQVGDPLGDTLAIITSDGVKSWRGKITVQTESKAEYDALDALLVSGEVLLLQDVVGRQWFIRTGELQEFEWLRSIADADEPRYPVRFLQRVGFGWTETRRPSL